MKKFKAMILALSLGVACVGNQMNLSAMSPEDREILDCKFSSLSTFINVISDDSRKVLSATILASPLHHIVIGQVPQKEVNRMM